MVSDFILSTSLPILPTIFSSFCFSVSSASSSDSSFSLASSAFFAIIASTSGIGTIVSASNADSQMVHFSTLTGLSIVQAPQFFSVTISSSFFSSSAAGLSSAVFSKADLSSEASAAFLAFSSLFLARASAFSAFFFAFSAFSATSLAASSLAFFSVAVRGRSKPSSSKVVF